jgi:hypothetical protein
MEESIKYAHTGSGMTGTTLQGVSLKSIIGKIYTEDTIFGRISECCKNCKHWKFYTDGHNPAYGICSTIQDSSIQSKHDMAYVSYNANFVSREDFYCRLFFRLTEDDKNGHI